jgi:chitin synthase
MSTFGLWIISGLLYLDPWHIINSMFQYLLLQPFWVNVMQVYAMCNTHDVTWGTVS